MNKVECHVTGNGARLYYRFSGGCLVAAVTENLNNCYYWDAASCLETAHWFAKMAKELKAKQKEAKRHGRR